MMNNTHKYFRNLRHKERLESKAHSCRTYWSHTMFYTKEPDPRDIRENNKIICYRATKLGSVEAAVEEYIEHDRNIGNGRFIYFERPEVPYSIHKVQTDPRYSKRKRDYKKYSNKLLRQRWKQRGEQYQYCQYKKIFDIAWELD